MAQQISNSMVNRPEGFLSAAFEINGLVFTSGNVGDDANGEYPESVEEQAHNAFKNLQATLEASGSSLDKVIKVLLFISDGDDAAKINAIYTTYFVNKPARSCIIVKFPNSKIKVELECVASVADIKKSS